MTDKKKPAATNSGSISKRKRNYLQRKIDHMEDRINMNNNQPLEADL
jgi:hypothetical protein